MSLFWKSVALPGGHRWFSTLMGRLLYNVLLPFYLLFALPGLLLKMRKRGGYGARFGQRFGKFDLETKASLDALKDTWWIHAVSVGEVLIAVKLIEEIRRQRLDQALVLSTTSSTGFATARDKAPAGMPVIYNPIDLPWILRRCFRLLRPSQIILTESEIWPNLLAEAQRRGVPVTVVNARLSPRSSRRYARWRALAGPTMGRLTLVCAQEKEDKPLWEAAGVEAERVAVLGSVKFDPMASGKPDARLRQLIGEMLDALGSVGRTRLLLGSSHAGEEAALAALTKELRQEFPALDLILVPRHFERGDEVSREVEALGLSVVRRSQWPAWKHSPMPQGTVLLVDSTGELGHWYEVADLVVIGKSFVGHGGQNPVEPLLCGKAVLVGPHMENFASLTRTLVEDRGLYQAGDVDDLRQALANLLRDPSERAAMAARARACLERHSGATRRTVEKLLAFETSSA